MRSSSSRAGRTATSRPSRECAAASAAVQRRGGAGSPEPPLPPRSSSLSLLHRPLGLLGMAAARAPRAFVRSQERSRGQQVHSRPGSASFGRAGICLAGDRAPARHRGLLKTRGFQSTATARAVRAALDSCGGPGRSAVASRSALLRRSTPRRLSCKNPAEQCAEHTAPLDRRAQACSFSFCLSQSLHPTSPPRPRARFPLILLPCLASLRNRLHRLHLPVPGVSYVVRLPWLHVLPARPRVRPNRPAQLPARRGVRGRGTLTRTGSRCRRGRGRAAATRGRRC
jgi:hypothetical protein